MEGWSNARLSGWLRMTAVGHEERFPPTKLSAGCGFRKETLAGMRRNGRDAPVADPGGPNAAGSSRPEAVAPANRPLRTLMPPVRTFDSRVA